LKTAKEIEAVEDWGIKDYITNIELGSYKVLDNDGHVLAIGKTSKEAKRKAYQIRQQMKAEGSDPGRLRVEVSFSPIKPIAERQEDGLKGEDNIFEVLPRYIYAMEKRIIMEPVIERYKQDKKADPKSYSHDVQDIIQGQIDYVMGNVYSWGDMIVDEIAQVFGWETGLYSKGVGKARSLVANLKLGYRPVAAFINTMGGFGNTWVGVGTKYWNKGFQVWQAGTYTNPDGVEIDMKEKLKQVEKYFGIDFAINADGSINTRIPLWKPLGLFQLPEKYIRPHGFLANYLYQVEVLGKSDAEATEAAKVALRIQNFSYNLSAISHILRSPSARLIGQFKTYLIKELEFMATLKGDPRAIMRMVGLQLAMAGPRGAVYMLQSIPILGAIGWWDDLEELLVKEKGFLGDVATRGVGGLMGADISAPATFQLPHRPEDWAGPFLSDAFKLFRAIIVPGLSSIGDREGLAYMKDDVVNWVTSLTPLSYYMKDLYSSIAEIDFGEGERRNLLKRLQKPDIWVRDSAGNRAYKVGGLHDRVLLAMGASPTEKTYQQVLRSGWVEDSKRRMENRRRWYRKVTKKLVTGAPISADLMMDAIKYGIDPSNIPSSIKYRELEPAQRELLKASLFDKAEALDHFGL